MLNNYEKIIVFNRKNHRNLAQFFFNGSADKTKRLITFRNTILQ